MLILIDSRETTPLEFNSEDYKVTTQRVGLPEADYSCLLDNGTHIPVVFERKSIGDLFGTMGKGYSRFKRMLERAYEREHQVILVIEGSQKKILSGYKHSSLNGLSIFRKLLTLRIRYGLEHHFFNSREDMAFYIMEYFSRYILNQKHLSKQKKTES